jgi:hypothetical protein
LADDPFEQELVISYLDQIPDLMLKQHFRESEESPPREILPPKPPGPIPSP